MKRSSGYERAAGEQTSTAMVDNAPQSRRGSRLARSFGLGGRSSETSSASLGCSGKEAEEVLQALTAQVRKLSVRIFIVVKKRSGGGGKRRGEVLSWSRGFSFFFCG